MGHTYQLDVYNADPPDVLESHGLPSITVLGIAGGQLPQGSQLPLQTITMDASMVGDHPFSCNNVCGLGHDAMAGTIFVVP